MPKLDGTETKTAFAARVGLTKGRISQLVAEGLPVRADGRIDVAEGLAWIETNLDPARRYKGGAPTATTRTATLAEAKRLQRDRQGPARPAGLRARAGQADRRRRGAAHRVRARPCRTRRAHGVGPAARRHCWLPRWAPIPAPPSPRSTG